MANKASHSPYLAMLYASVSDKVNLKLIIKEK